MDEALKEIVKAFKQDFKPEQCENFYRLTNEQLIFTIGRLKQLMYHTNEEITPFDLEGLFYFIQQDEVVEIFMNELIAPYTPGRMVGSNLEGEFVRSIGMYDHFSKEIGNQEGAIMIAPILVVCSIIQNAYLFINDLDAKEDIQECLERCQSESEQLIDMHTIYDHVVHIILKPLLEVLLYRSLQKDKNVPQFIITSFGLITAEYAIEHGNEISKQIEESLASVVNSIIKNRQTKEDDIIN